MLYFNLVTGGIGAAIGATNAILADGDIAQGAATGFVVGGLGGLTFGGSILVNAGIGAGIGAVSDIIQQKL